MVPLWRSTPLDLIDTHKLCHGYRQSLDAFSQILGSHDGPIKGLIAGKFRSNGKERAKRDEWFRSRAIDQLEKLSYNDGHMRLLPTPALRFAPMLCLAKLMNCHPPLIRARSFSTTTEAPRAHHRPHPKG